MIKQYEKGKAVKLSANFKSTEFDCHGKGCCNPGAGSQGAAEPV